jgi:hypothetical protein
MILMPEACVRGKGRCDTRGAGAYTGTVSRRDRRLLAWTGDVGPAARQTLLVTLATAAFAISPQRAFGQTATDQAAAETLFKQARDLMTAGKFSDACPKFAESERLDPSPGTLLNLATCYEKNGQVTSAWATYKEAATAAQNAKEADRAKLARSKAAALETTLPTLTIVVPAATDRPDLQVTRDGQAVGRAAWGTPIPVDPGPHTVQASAPGHKTWQRDAPVAGAGAKVSVEVPPLDEDTAAPPGPAPAPVPPAPAVPQETSASTPGSTQRVLGVIVAGMGVAGLAVGSVAGFVAMSKNHDVPSQCSGSVCNAQGISSLDGAKTAATTSTVGFVAGGIAVAAGAILYLTAPRAHPATGWVLEPGSEGSVAGLTLRGVWR